MGGVSVAGFLPGLGRGGITHSLDVMDIFGGSGAGFGLMTDDMPILLMEGRVERCVGVGGEAFVFGLMEMEGADLGGAPPVSVEGVPACDEEDGF